MALPSRPALFVATLVAGSIESESAAKPKPIVRGRDLIARGLRPGPSFKPILDRCYEAQLDGAFSDLPGGLAFLEELKVES